MNYEQKRLVVRVYLPGPAQQVTDWEAVARALAEPGFTDLDAMAKEHTTERPSRIDTGVDLVIHQSSNDGHLYLEFDGRFLYMWPDQHQSAYAALGFPTEPMQVVETQAEGEVSP